VVILETSIPESFGIDPKEDFSGSLYRLIEEKYQIPIITADQIIEASKATEDQAALLEINPGDSILVMERTTFTTNDIPLEYVIAIYRSDHYKYHIRLNR